MSDIESEKDVSLNPDETLTRDNENERVERESLWEGNVNEKFAIKESTENNGRFDVVLEEPYQDIHVNTTLQNNKMHGESTVSSENGVVLGVLTFVEGIATGPCTLNYESGKLYFKGNMEDGYRQGRGTEYDESGNVIFDGFFAKGAKLENIIPLEEMKGYWKEYDNDHKLVSVSQRDDLGRKEGVCYFYDGEGKISRISEWKEDKEISTSGYCEIYDEPRHVWFKGYYENGKRVLAIPLEEKKGYWKESNEDNMLVSICSKDTEGKYNGVCYMYSNERINRVSYWEHGKEIRSLKEFNGSTMTEFDENGQKVYEGEYYDSFESDYPRHGQGTSYKNNEVNKKTTWLAGYSKQGLLLTLLAIIVVMILCYVIDVFLGIGVTVVVYILVLIRWCCPKSLGSKICNKTDLQLMADYKKTESPK